MNNKTKLSLTMHGITTSIEFPYEDVDLNQLFSAFNTVLVGATFTEEQYKDYVIELGQDFSEQKQYDNE
jgi:hypothetical protein